VRLRLVTVTLSDVTLCDATFCSSTVTYDDVSALPQPWVAHCFKVLWFIPIYNINVSEEQMMKSWDGKHPSDWMMDIFAQKYPSFYITFIEYTIQTQSLICTNILIQINTMKIRKTKFFLSHFLKVILSLWKIYNLQSFVRFRCPIRHQSFDPFLPDEQECFFKMLLNAFEWFGMPLNAFKCVWMLMNAFQKSV
jgi:hypothetical protein